jgi:hypothetical protein
MRDTVELLEAIGRDATLRRASPEALAQALEANDASTGLLELVASGDSTSLTEELGLKQLHVEHMVQTGGHEGDGHDDHHHHHDDDHGDGKEDKPKQHPEDPKSDTPSS